MKRNVWIVLALVLLVLASYLMSAGRKVAEVEPPKVNFPRFATTEEHQRSTKRRTLLTMREPETQGAPRQEIKRDPLLAVLPGNAKFGVVIEANAIRNSPFGEMLLACTGTTGAEALEKFRSESGLDALNDLDRVAVVGDSVVITGNFAGLKSEALEKELGPASTYGDKARVFSSEGGEFVGIWNDEMLLTAKSREELERSVDVLEGRAPPPENPAIDESLAFGEAYGQVSVDFLANLLPEKDGLQAKVREAIQNVELHATTFGDVALVAKLDGPDAEKVEDLARSLGGALALFRMQAKSETGKEAEELSALLDLAKVERGRSGSFELELALPLSYIKKKLGPCAEKVVIP